MAIGLVKQLVFPLRLIPSPLLSKLVSAYWELAILGGRKEPFNIIHHSRINQRRGLRRRRILIKIGLQLAINTRLRTIERKTNNFPNQTKRPYLFRNIYHNSLLLRFSILFLTSTRERSFRSLLQRANNWRLKKMSGM